MRSRDTQSQLIRRLQAERDDLKSLIRRALAIEHLWAPPDDQNDYDNESVALAQMRQEFREAVDVRTARVVGPAGAGIQLFSTAFCNVGMVCPGENMVDIYTAATAYAHRVPDDTQNVLLSASEAMADMRAIGVKPLLCGDYLLGYKNGLCVLCLCVVALSWRIDNGCTDDVLAEALYDPCQLQPE